jgi:hypothetical protein
MKPLSKVLLFILIGCVAFFCALFWRFNQIAYPRYGKGGVGIVDSGIFVFTNSDLNQIEWDFGVNGRGAWKGMPRKVEEIVVFDGLSVQPFTWSALLNRQLVIRFNSDRIFVYDTKRLSGFNYLRSD